MMKTPKDYEAEIKTRFPTVAFDPIGEGVRADMRIGARWFRDEIHYREMAALRAEYNELKKKFEDAWECYGETVRLHRDRGNNLMEENEALEAKIESIEKKEAPAFPKMEINCFGEHGYNAILKGYPGFVAEGDTEEEAIEELMGMITTKLIYEWKRSKNKS